MAENKNSCFDVDDYTFAPHDKGIVIMKDGEMQYMAMPETIIRMSTEHDDMSRYLECPLT